VEIEQQQLCYAEMRGCPFCLHILLTVSAYGR
jgi:hypothetical protein